MILWRLSFVAVLAAALVLGVAAERRAVEPEPLPEQATAGTPIADGRPWFCAGGSVSGGPDSPALAGLEIINAGSARVEPEITVMGSDPGDVVSRRVTVEPFGRTAVALGEMSAGSAWVAAVVEPGGPDVVVDQTHTGPGGTDRSSCATSTASTVLLPDGATRELAHGEKMTLLLFNPLRNDSIVDVVFEADTGSDSLEAVVVPASRVLAVDVTSEVAVAGRVSTTIDVASGSVAASRIQIHDGTAPEREVAPACPRPAQDPQDPGDDGEAAAGPAAGLAELQGLSVMPGIADGAAVSVLPSVRRCEGRNVVSVTNPSRDERAEVNLELIADAGAGLAPIKLTVRPGRTVQVDLEAEERLAALSGEDFSIVARSLSGLPVAVMIEQLVPRGEPHSPGAASMGAIDAASTRWLAPLDGDGGAISVVNPSATSPAKVSVSAAGEAAADVLSLELGPGERARIEGGDLGPARPVVVVDASSPVVVGREHVGDTSRRSITGIIAGPVTALAELG